ncbi:OLC1v1035675C1 [Oldenlandia corymbosa var. corymbosa]|uniref:DNA (cytosine-5-)-methyltransferase n=1 Tax=Oldenlandia corymbosa var. corymbosa TaxID=529605 RepID=A0AAV1CTK7_OLDCO|nr:OLC1v1035675C1 [Oldenlandia corymbosa var. corymbosa]
MVQENNDGSGSIDWSAHVLDKANPASFPTSSGPSAGESSSSHSGNIKRFLEMGFPDKLVVKALEEHGEESEDSTIVDAILTYMTLENEAAEERKCTDVAECSSGYDENRLYLSDSDDWNDYWFEDEENMELLTENDKKKLTLQNMGFSVEDAETATEKCPEASIDELSDFIFAVQTARKEEEEEEPANLPTEVRPNLNDSRREVGKRKKRAVYPESQGTKKRREIQSQEIERIRIPKPMVGFGLPRVHDSQLVTSRILPEQAMGPPYFYYENVAQTPKGVWKTISSYLYNVVPEFVDSKYFSAAARKRGYVHNLPIEGRSELLPILPCTIHEAFPYTREWWPSWDPRTQLNCLLTSTPTAVLQKEIRKTLQVYDELHAEPPEKVKKEILGKCRRWNLLWVGKNRVAQLEPNEIEILLGFPENHTRGIGMSTRNRYKSLGNSFQVNTVAYHLSVLKRLYPEGINVLSLFSGIGGAEVALHRLGIPLKNVVSVEISEDNRKIIQTWWENTLQPGKLLHFDDVQRFNEKTIQELITSLGGFDLVIGGSPCNNLAGRNVNSRDGLEGKDSSLFYDYVRILKTVRSIMRN